MPIEGDVREAVFVCDLYPELREMAARLLRRERDDHTLQRTALVHETFIRLLARRSTHTDSSEGFLARAAHLMREILIDYGRRRHAKKRGGDFARVALFEADQALRTDRDEDGLIALNQALDQLGKIDQRALSVVELKFFCGCTNAEAAKILRMSDGTVESDWQFARSQLFGILTRKSPRSQV